MKRDIQICYSTINTIINDLYSFKTALESIGTGMKDFESFLEENAGESVDAIKTKGNEIHTNLKSCHQEIEDLHTIFSNYAADMSSIINAINPDTMTRVDRNDIWANMISIQNQVDNLEAAKYLQSHPRNSGLMYDVIPEEERKKYKYNYNVLKEFEKTYLATLKLIQGEMDAIEHIYTHKVKAFENMDDTYAGKANEIYNNYTTAFGVMKDGALNLVDGFNDFAEGLGKAVYDLIAGIYNLVENALYYMISGIAILVSKPFGYCPDWASDYVSNVHETAGTIVDDPMLIIEGLAQSSTDSIDEEGICFGVGYVSGDVIAEIIATKGIGKIGSLGKVDDIGDVGKIGRKVDVGDECVLEGGSNASKGIKSWDDISATLEKEGLTKSKVDEILNTPKGNRPEPSTYLSDTYINEHLSNFQNGVTKIKSRAPVDIEGVGLGTFVMPKATADDVISRAGGDVSKLKELLGLNPGDLGINPVRVDIANPQNVRIPSGNEAGAWPGFWTPGGYTKPGGVIEAVIDPVSKDNYIVTENILGK